MAHETPPVAALATLNRTGVTLGNTRVLSDITFSVEPGEVVGVVGANGSGKTTLLRLIASLIAPDRGDGTVLGARLGTSEVFTIRRRIGLISHIPTTIPELTLEENLLHAVRLAGHETAKVADSLRAVGLEGSSDRKASDSSFGMKRRTEVARLLITKPSILLLDEAISGLDSDAHALIDALVDRTVGSGGAVIVVSHDPLQMEKASTVFGLAVGALTEMT
ncbi:MAG: ATP-binding cassette domain-containing protein [Actinobacteria bacterium]|nr:ATP-binding cassette domain-containing protein [Actinomycetota bacterium]